MRPDWCALAVIPVLITPTPSTHAFLPAPKGRSALLHPSRNNSGAAATYYSSVALQRSGRSNISVHSSKLPTPDDGRASNDKKAPRGKENPASTRNSNGGSKDPSRAKRTRRRPSHLGATSTRTATQQQQQSRRDRDETAADGSTEPDRHVLVPVKDVVTVPLSDISQAAADSLGGGEATRLSMERFSMTLESVFRTEFSVKVDRANAGSVIGGRRNRSSAKRRSQSASGSAGGARAAPQTMRESSADRAGGGGNDEVPETDVVETATAAGTEMVASVDGKSKSKTGAKGKRPWWRRGWMSGKKKEETASGDKEASPVTLPSSDVATAAVAEGRQGRRGGGSGKKKNRGGGGGGGDDRPDETAAVPLLELVEELVKNAMFSPIGARDVMMSQALAAEFPTAAGVRPVYGNLANVYELLRQSPSEEESGSAPESNSRAKDAAEKRKRENQRAMLPFEGRLLVFHRGNGVEATKGRLLLKKLDFLQSNAVGWLSQSVTDSLKACQQQVVGLVDTVSRDVTRRRDSVVRSCAEGAIAFGLERESLERFLPVTNVTEVALAKEQDALDEALEALRRNSRRGPVNLQRYGMRQANVKLEEFSEGGAWPPEDDSWFWGTNAPIAADAGEQDAQGGISAEGMEAEVARNVGEGRDSIRASVDTATPGKLQPRINAPSTVLPRVTLASVLIPPIRSAALTLDGLVTTSSSRGGGSGSSSARSSRSSSGGSSSSSSGGSSKSKSKSKSNSDGSKKNAKSKANRTGKGGKSQRASGLESESKSVLARLLSKCTVKEPTYDEVVVVYFKRTRRPKFKPPPAVATMWKVGTKIGNQLRGVEEVDIDPDDADELEDAGLGLQLRVYRGVPLVNLNAIAPDKKVEVRPQTALRLDLNSVVGLGLVLANQRFDSPVLVAAATVSVVLLVIRTIVGYLNARIRVESFVSRDILDKTMGSNVPVLRHLAEEAAQQKSRHVALVYVALLQCVIGSGTTAVEDGVQWDDLMPPPEAVSIAAVSRYCGTLMKACIGLPWEAKVDVPHWLNELENLKILVRVDADGESKGYARTDENVPRSLPLALEGLPIPTAVASTSPPSQETPKKTEIAAAAAATAAAARRPRPRPDPTTTTFQAEPSEIRPGTEDDAAVVVSYRLLDPDTAVEQLKLKWSELVEPPGSAGKQVDCSAGSSRSSEGRTPWTRRLGDGAL